MERAIANVRSQPPPALPTRHLGPGDHAALDLEPDLRHDPFADADDPDPVPCNWRTGGPFRLAGDRKTRMVYLGDGQEGFDFLGFHIRMVMSRRYQRRYCQHGPSSRAMASIRERIRATTAPRRKLKQPSEEIVRELNPVIRGWGQYFRVGNSTRQLVQIDRHVQERLALFDSKKRQKSGRRWGTVHTNAWHRKLAVHRLTGTIRYTASATGVT